MPLILLAANSAWNISNYRLGLVKALQTAGFAVAVAVPADGDVKELESAGVAVHRIDMQPRGTSPVADGQLYLEYRNLLRRLRPAAVLSFTVKPNA